MQSQPSAPWCSPVGSKMKRPSSWVVWEYKDNQSSVRRITTVGWCISNPERVKVLSEWSKMMMTLRSGALELSQNPSEIYFEYLYDAWHNDGYHVWNNFEHWCVAEWLCLGELYWKFVVNTEVAIHKNESKKIVTSLLSPLVLSTLPVMPASLRGAW